MTTATTTAPTDPALTAWIVAMILDPPASEGAQWIRDYEAETGEPF